MKSGGTEFVHGLTAEAIVSKAEELLPPHIWPHQGFEWYNQNIQIGLP